MSRASMSPGRPPRRRRRPPGPGPATAAVVAPLAVAVVVALAPGRAAADPPVPITDRDWTLDLHDSSVQGSARVVGMGGAQVALAEGSAGTLANPAAPATRKATSTDWWDWDFHLDALSAVYASDFDNNGLIDDARTDRHLTAGLAGMFHTWGVAVVVTSQTTSLDGTGQLVASGAVGKLAVARSWADEDWSVGGAVRVGTLSIAGADPLFSITGSGLEAGVIYKPFRTDLRVGATASLPITGSRVQVAACDPLDCEGHILPERVAVPWQLAVGGAWRRAPTRWNQWVGGKFRDEHALIVAADLVLIGAGRDTMGLEAFGRGLWQPAGRSLALSARAGVEWEALPGRLRLRGGSYWEPSRFDGVGGRPHATAGIEIGVVTVRVWGRRYRLRVGATGDFAARFGNAGLSLGFWS